MIKTKIITKKLKFTPNLLNYEKTSQAFRWEEAEKKLAGLPGVD